LLSSGRLHAQQQAPQTEFEAEFYMQSDIMQNTYSKCKISQNAPGCPDTVSICAAYVCEDNYIHFWGDYTTTAASFSFSSIPGILKFYDDNSNYLSSNTYSFNVAQSPGGFSLQLLYEESGVYQFVIELKDADGNCLHLVKYNIIVYENIIANPFIQITPNPVCVGDNVTISSGLNNATHQFCWTFSAPYHQYNSTNCQYNSFDNESITFEVTGPDDIEGMLFINSFCSNEHSFPVLIKVKSLEIEDVIITETDCKTYSYTPIIECGVAPLTYNWTFVGGIPATSTDAEPTIEYTGVGNHNYTLVVTDALGYTASYSGNVNIPASPSSPQIIGESGINPLNACLQNEVYTVNNANNNFNYHWSSSINSSGAGSSTTPLTFPLSGGTVSFTVTDEHNCTASSTINILPCCGDFNDPEKVVIVPQQYATSLAAFKNQYDNSVFDLNSQAGVFQPNKVFVFNYDMALNAGTFTFEGANTINNNLRFGANVKWTASSSGQNVTFDNCWLTNACEDYMWGGLAATHVTDEIHLINNSRLEFALKGISSSNGAKIEALNAIFDNNATSIDVNGTGYSGANPLTVKGCQFICSNHLLLPYSTDAITQQPYRSVMGINLLNCYGVGGATNEITIGSDIDIEQNTFENMYFGININNSRVNLGGFNQFVNIRRNPPIPQSGQFNIPVFYNGAAIIVTNTNISQYLSRLNWSGNGSNNSFIHINRCDRGVVLANGALFSNLSQLRIQDTDRGVHIVNPIIPQIAISGNEIVNCQQGIFSTASNGGSIRITENSITLSPYGSGPGTSVIPNRGIALVKPQNTAITPYYVYCNQIFNNRNSVGIEVQGQGVFCNIQGNSVLHNEATNTAEQGVSTGIVAYNSIGSGIYGNVVQAAPWSMNSRRIGYSIYANEKLNLRCNTSNRNFIGFRFNQSNLGIQVQSNTFGTHHNAMRFVGISHPYVLGGPVYGTNNTFPNSYVTVGVPGVGIRNNSATPSVELINTSNLPFSTTTINASFTPLPSMQLLTCQTISCLPDTNIHPTSIIPDSVEYRISDDEYIENITNEALRRAMQMYLYRNIVNDSLLYLQIPQFAEFFNAHQQSEFAQFVRLYERLNHSLDSAGNLSVDSTYRDLIEELRMQLLQIAADNLPAIYERDIAKIYLQYFTHNDDTLISTADIDRLIEIANKCPIVSGYAVYDAQALLRILNPEIEFDWLVNCEDPSLRTEEEYTNDYDTTFAIVPILYPNPVNNILNISGLSGKEKIIIYNTQSQILKEMIAIGNQIAISTHDLSNGVYTLSILSIESTVVKKFVVIR
jgi:hypothetical protein